MRIATLIVIAVGSALLLGSTETPPPSLLRNDAPAIAVLTQVRPVTADDIQLLRRVKPGMFRCSATVFPEPGKNVAWGTKDLILAPGESDETIQTLGGVQMHFRASIDRKAERATTAVTVTRDDRIITQQRSSVWLAKPEQTH